VRAESLRRGRLLPNEGNGMYRVWIAIVAVRAVGVAMVAAVAPVFLCSYHHEVDDLHLTGVLCEYS